MTEQQILAEQFTSVSEDKPRFEYPENVFVWTRKKNTRQLEKVLKTIPEISSMNPTVLSENVRSDTIHYCGCRINNDLKLDKGQTGFAVQIPFGFELASCLPAWIDFVIVTDTDKDVLVFKPIAPEQFFVNKKGQFINEKGKAVKK